MVHSSPAHVVAPVDERGPPGHFTHKVLEEDILEVALRCSRHLAHHTAVIGPLYLDLVFMQETFERAKAWVKELQRQASPNIVIALAGNKADLAERRLVEYEEAQTYAEDTGLLFMETSAKTAMNVNELFLAIAKKMPKTDTQNPTHAARHRGVNLQDPDAHSTRACCGGN